MKYTSQLKMTLVSMLIYFSIPVTLYILITLFLTIFGSWGEIIHNEVYNDIYWGLISWWIGIFPIIAYQDDVKRINYLLKENLCKH